MLCHVASKDDIVNEIMKCSVLNVHFSYFRFSSVDADLWFRELPES